MILFICPRGSEWDQRSPLTYISHVKGNIIRLARFIQYRVHFLPLLSLINTVKFHQNHIIQYILIVICIIIFVCAENDRVLKGEAQGMGEFARTG